MKGFVNGGRVVIILDDVQDYEAKDGSVEIVFSDGSRLDIPSKHIKASKVKPRL